MKKNTEKSNEQHLRELLMQIKGLLPKEGEEAEEFFESMIKDYDVTLGDRVDEIQKLKNEISELEYEEPEEAEYENTEELGLDTFKWALENGNMVIEGLVQDFVQSVKKKYAMFPA